MGREYLVILGFSQLFMVMELVATGAFFWLGQNQHPGNNGDCTHCVENSDGVGIHRILAKCPFVSLVEHQHQQYFERDIVGDTLYRSV